MDDARFDAWCPKFGCVGVSVEYRLAPETPYPGPLDDCYLGLKWVYDHHDEIGVDPDHIGIGGVSAGRPAAGLALLVRDRGKSRCAFSFSTVPCSTTASPRHPASSTASMSGTATPTPSAGARTSATSTDSGYSAVRPPAARATDLTGLPPAYICVGGVDGFRDEDIIYATRLNQAGVPADLHVYSGAPHGVMMFTDVPVAKRYAEGTDAWVGQQLRRS